MRIFEFLAVAAALTILPGPDILLVMAQSLTRGARAGIVLALGLCTGLIFHTTAVALGLAAVIKGSPAAFNAIKYAGIAYMLWLSYKAFAEKGGSGESAASKDDRTGLYKRGILMNLLNPKVILFFLALLPQFLRADAAHPATDIFILGGVFIAQALVVFSTVSLLAGWVSARIPARVMTGRVMNIVEGTVFLVIALFLLLS